MMELMGSNSNLILVKAVAAPVSNRGVHSLPKGQWRNWLSEAFNFFTQLLINSLK